MLNPLPPTPPPPLRPVQLLLQLALLEQPGPNINGFVAPLAQFLGTVLPDGTVVAEAWEDPVSRVGSGDPVIKCWPQLTSWLNDTWAVPLVAAPRTTGPED